VIAVEMREEHGCDERRRTPCADETHDHTSTSVNNDVLAAGLHKCGWSRTCCTREWAAGSEQGDLHGSNLTLNSGG
jgi:hypothetical protein